MNINKSACTLKNNYFDLSLTIATTDFLSLDETFLTAPRQVDGNLPETPFLKLNTLSNLIDAGIDIGFPFKGKKPDLGCYESEK